MFKYKTTVQMQLMHGCEDTMDAGQTIL